MPDMNASWAAFGVTLLVGLASVRTFHLHGKFTGDATDGGPQKRHAYAVPRVGGVAIFLGLLAGACYLALGIDADALMLQIMLATLPAFAAGVIEDVTKKVSPLWRLLATLVSGALACAVIYQASAGLTGFWADGAPSWPLLAALSVVVAVGIAGMCNAMNLIDGFNGLSSGCSVIMLMAIAAVARQVGDDTVYTIATTVIGAALAFMMWNFPQGRLFLGDGGAYLLGGLLATLSLLLVVRNPVVSPLLPLLVCIYPVFETLFSIYRRCKRNWRSAFRPDSLHLHSLIYRRFTRGFRSVVVERRHPSRNPCTSPFLWALCMVSAVPCALWWQDGAALVLGCVMFALCYVAVYRTIVRFKIPSAWVVQPPTWEEERAFRESRQARLSRYPSL